MADPHSQSSTPAPVLEYASIRPARAPFLTRLGGSLGLAGCCVGLLVFLVGCAGFNAAMGFSPIPLILGAAGILLSLAGGFTEHEHLPEDTAVLSAVFTSALSLIGGAAEVSVWLAWR
ncbi:MAG TPA: hypothetical protein VG269_02235 [Tepidisphaeraceae bacterium]|jgi:hypothetical protein|nr:hypothetical protein [Tepidisphaeraceae bacterium]